MTRKYVQCRLRRMLREGAGYSEMVAYLPAHGTNGLAVEPGRVVKLSEDKDERPWSLLSVSGSVVDAAFIQRKQREYRRLSGALT